MKMWNYKLNKKSQVRFLNGILIGIIVIGIFSLAFVLAEEGEEVSIGNSLNLEAVDGKINLNTEWFSTNIKLENNGKKINLNHQKKENFIKIIPSSPSLSLDIQNYDYIFSSSKEFIVLDRFFEEYESNIDLDKSVVPLK